VSALRAPQQARSQRTWSRILDAGVDILEERGHESFTIAAICERAGVTPPSLYARAPDKPTLLRAIHEHAVTRVNADLALPADLAPGAAVATIARAFLANRRLLRAIIRHAGVEPTFFDSGSASIIELGRGFRRAVGGSEQRADACFRIVIGALTHRVVEGEQFTSDLPQSDDEFVASLCEMSVRYLAA
jgi:AcrR family transcriptional regulator